MNAGDASFVELRRACCGYARAGGTPVLRDVDLTLARGSSLALLGANGSGKTTLLRSLAGLLPLVAGSISLAGRSLQKWADRELYQWVGFAFQDSRDQLLGPTVADDVAFGPRNLGLDPNTIAQRVASSLASVGASALAERQVHHLSVGEQRRVALAGILAMQPALLLLDEPTAGLDPQGQEQLIELLNALRDVQSLTLIVATHDVDAVPRLADQVVVLGGEGIALQGPTRAVLTQEAALRDLGLRSPQVAGLVLDLAPKLGLTTGQCALLRSEARSQIEPRLGPLSSDATAALENRKESHGP